MDIVSVEVRSWLDAMIIPMVKGATQQGYHK